MTGELCDMDVFSQDPFRCRLEWGVEGAGRAARRGNIIVVVDTLSFTTAVVTAVQRGGLVYPCAPEEDAVSVARRAGGEIAVNRRDVPALGRFSLSPETYEVLDPGTRVVLASPNGARCVRAGRNAPWVFAGALVNARAVAGAVGSVMESTGLDTTLIPCGEQWEWEEARELAGAQGSYRPRKGSHDPCSEAGDGRLRVAIEDYLGAGAILSHLAQARSPEAELCTAAYTAVRDRLPELIGECASGRELRAKGFEQDVRRASQLDAFDAVPVLRSDRFEPWAGEGAGPSPDDTRL